MSMGHSEVFTHVGDRVRVHAPNGRQVAPLVTGTFGSSDFIFSLLGGACLLLVTVSNTDLVLSEAGDKLVRFESDHHPQYC